MGERRVGPQGRRKGTTSAGASTVGLAPVQGQGRNERRRKRIEDRERERSLIGAPFSHGLGSSEAQRLERRAGVRGRDSLLWG